MIPRPARSVAACARLSLSMALLWPVCASPAQVADGPTELPLAQTEPASPPDGRPPLGPLRRTTSRLWGVQVTISLPPIVVPPNVSESLLIPVTLLDTWSIADVRSFAARMSINQKPITPALTPLTILQRPGRESQIEVPIPDVDRTPIGLPTGPDRGMQVMLDVQWTVECFSVALDEPTAMRIGWPQSWPDELARWRGASAGIDPADPTLGPLKDAVRAACGGDAPPLAAAKACVRAGSQSLRNPNFRQGSPMGVFTRGVEIRGATAALRDQQGTPADLTCICVALLRSVGLPARAVIGLANESDGPMQSASDKELTVWGEVWLPECGWIPFDPDRVRGGVGANAPLAQRWSGFGTEADWEQWIPITHEVNIFRPSPPGSANLATVAALCRLKTQVSSGVAGPTDILLQTRVANRGRPQR